MRIPKRTRVTLADGNGGPEGARREFCLSRARTLVLCGLVLISWAVVGVLLADVMASRNQAATIAELQKQLDEVRLEALRAGALTAELEQMRSRQTELLAMLGLESATLPSSALGDSLCDLPTRGATTGEAAAVAEAPGPRPARWPAAGTIIREFTPGDPGSGVEGHAGVDIAGPPGGRVVAAADGEVDFIGDDAVLGKYLEIRHGADYTTVYGHCESVRVGLRAKVRAGEQVAKMGHSGQTATNQVHFEVWYRGEAVDPREVLAGDPPAR